MIQRLSVVWRHAGETEAQVALRLDNRRHEESSWVESGKKTRTICVVQWILTRVVNQLRHLSLLLVKTFMINYENFTQSSSKAKVYGIYKLIPDDWGWLMVLRKSEENQTSLHLKRCLTSRIFISRLTPRWSLIKSSATIFCHDNNWEDFIDRIKFHVLRHLHVSLSIERLLSVALENVVRRISRRWHIKQSNT